MKSLGLLIVGIILWNTSFTQNCQNCPQNRGGVRLIEPGRGQEFSKKFCDPTCMHFVQFAVYPKSHNYKNLKAPLGLGQIMLISHPHTYVRGISEPGAYYIVKGFLTKAEALRAVKRYKARGYNCWYNPDLTDPNIRIVMLSQ